ncbi:unnamed protein product [Brassicogethes aeneus]|uniref:G-protein coupled receptors family 1 profile domain-containing protein n=1 Tax=Brassicogethes aeneus TaxID=1431903 RepID=A0A9P0FDK5_BRAAE|nr:unnamed protein product [Brassicogethes aeneus]
MESDYHWLITATLVASSVVAITANFFLLLVFCRRRGLRTVPNRFVINLLVTNLLSSILLIPLLLTDQGFSFGGTSLNSTVNTTELIEKIEIKEVLSDSDSSTILNRDIEIIQNGFGEEDTTNRVLLCYFAQSSTSFVCTASIFSILLIGINQYFGVIHSLRYHFYINKCRSSIFIISSWVVSLLCSILGTLTYSDNSLWNFCSTSSEPSDILRILNTVYAISYFIMVILAPFAAICLIYYCIYNAAHKNSERMRKSTSSNANLEYTQVAVPRNIPKVQSAPNFGNLVKNNYKESEVKDDSAKTANNGNFINNLKHKISNASVFKYREETRAAKISIIVILTVLVCYIPYGITLVLSCEFIKVKPGQIFNYLSLILLVFSNIISPFLFGYRNKRIKREIGKMLGIAKPTNHNRISTLPRDKITRNHSLENELFLNVPEVIITYKPENERKSILKKYTSSWTSYKKCNFITVPDGCCSGEARGSFSSASTQISNEE